ncbi:hypothetical protein [Nostoc flagelliforme]|uniref:hypothetical protein n=1 Tax=Nostoc flagelliforme TaxID=1306274 RepID=UPI0012FDB6C2|nr:hypothetical protein [Nostoc flagelliforme]
MVEDPLEAIALKVAGTSSSTVAGRSHTSHVSGQDVVQSVACIASGSMPSKALKV